MTQESEDKAMNPQTGTDPTPCTERKARYILDNYYIGPARDPKVLEI